MSINKLKFHVDRLNSYNYCPAKFRLELPKSVGARLNPTKVYSTFDIYRKMFSRWAKYRNNKSQLSFHMNRFMKTYESRLFPEGRSLSAEVVVAYQQKIFDQLIQQIGPDASIELPGMLSVDYDESKVIDINIDMSYVVKNTDGNWNTKVYGFVILVPEENWNPIDLSNRFERAIIAKHIFPKVIEHRRDASYEIVYFNPKSGKSYTIPGIYNNDGITADLKRLEYMCDRIEAKDFVKRPVEALCKKCPVKSRCMPKDFGRAAETQLADPLKLP